MITKVDSSYAGHIDMDNVGYAGTAVNDRRFPNEHPVAVYDKARAMAQMMDRLGYDTFWTAEHHFGHCGALWSAGNPFRGAQHALDFMAKCGIQGMVGGGSAEGGAIHKVVLDWQAAQARVGRH